MDVPAFIAKPNAVAAPPAALPPGQRYTLNAISLQRAPDSPPPRERVEIRIYPRRLVCTHAMVGEAIINARGPFRRHANMLQVVIDFNAPTTNKKGEHVRHVLPVDDQCNLLLQSVWMEAGCKFSAFIHIFAGVAMENLSLAILDPVGSSIHFEMAAMVQHPRWMRLLCKDPATITGDLEMPHVFMSLDEEDGTGLESSAERGMGWPVRT